MATQLRTTDRPFETAFEVDADLTWVEMSAYQITKRQVEGQGEISDYIASTPKRASLEGMITAMALLGATATPQKLTQARDSLQALADARQPVLVLSNLYAGYLGIEQFEVTQSVDVGIGIKVSIQFVEIRTTAVGTAQVPASKLRPKVKRRGGTGRRGGAAQGSRPQSTLANVDDTTGRKFSKALRF